MILMFGNYFSYVWGLVFLRLRVSVSYVCGLVFLRLGVSNSHVHACLSFFTF